MTVNTALNQTSLCTDKDKVSEMSQVGLYFFFFGGGGGGIIWGIEHSLKTIRSELGKVPSKGDFQHH